jgi:hypothetical protein
MKTPPREIPKTTEGLRDALFEEINLLRQDKTTPNRARALSQLARDIIDSIRVQIQYQRLITKDGAKPMQLGSPDGKA